MAEASEKGVTDLSSSRLLDSDYAQVIFQDILESYAVDSNVECRYTITSVLVPTEKDWVGLYKVGWRSPKEYVCFEYSPLSSGEEGKKFVDNRIVFSGKHVCCIHI